MEKCEEYSARQLRPLFLLTPPDYLLQTRKIKKTRRMRINFILSLKCIQDVVLPGEYSIKSYIVTVLYKKCW